MRQSRAWALVAWLLAATSLWLPWWRIRFRDLAGNVIDEAHLRHFQDGAPFAETGAIVLTGILVGIALLVLFIRLAARSWLHEPGQWLRDLVVVTSLLIAALLSTWGWPAGESVAPSFWGGVEFTHNQTGDSFSVQATPGLGWWTAAVAVVCMGMSMWRAAIRK